eukprot:1141334-Pelagomonas_calceolata.AAC.9
MAEQPAVSLPCGVQSPANRRTPRAGADNAAAHCTGEGCLEVAAVQTANIQCVISAQACLDA